MKDTDRALDALRHAVRLKPEYIEGYYDLAVALTHAGRLDEAVAVHRRLLELKPEGAESLTKLASALEDQGRTDDAIAIYHDLMRLRPDDATIRQSLGLLYVAHGRTAEGAEAFQHAIELEPQQASYRNNIGAALAELGRPTKAISHFETAIHLDPNHAEAHKSLGMTCLQLGDFERGWCEFEWRWKCKDFRVRSLPQRLWDGSECRGQTILLYTEQGIGDTFQFVRYALELFARGARVLIECPAPLVPLLQTCPGVAQVVASGERLPRFHCHAALMSLPRLLGIKVTTIPAKVPYLAADTHLSERWRQEFCGRQTFKVGIVWQGNPQNASDFRRSIPLEHFAPLGAVPGVELFSLQVGAGADQLAKLGSKFSITDLGCRLDAGTFRVTAAVLCNLDLLISCDTAAAHLAGALGKPVWVALSYAADWRWLLDRQDSPWYPTMRLFRQFKLGDWATVFEQMAIALRTLASP